MANEKKLNLTEEEFEAMVQKRLEEANAAKAATAPTEDSGESGDKSDKGKKTFADKVKDKVNGFWNLDLKLTPGKIVLAAVGIPAAILGVRWVYDKGVEAGKSEAEFATALPDNGEPLMLETTAEPDIIEASVEDYESTDEVYED